MRRHLIIFARTPRYGRVKTRLARDIGTIETLRFYRNTLHHVTRQLATIRNLSMWVALTPDVDVDEGAGPVFHDIALKPQGSGDLGKRMARALDDCSAGPVVLIGSDIPSIKPFHIETAFRALGENDAVFGPSQDGGYWLVGLKRRQSTPPHFMHNVRWSSRHALEDTVATLPKRWKVSYIQTLVDIDDEQTYNAWKACSKR